MWRVRKGLNCSIKKSYFFFEKIMDNFYEKKTSYLKRNVQ